MNAAEMSTKYICKQKSFKSPLCVCFGNKIYPDSQIQACIICELLKTALLLNLMREMHTEREVFLKTVYTC